MRENRIRNPKAPDPEAAVELNQNKIYKTVQNAENNAPVFKRNFLVVNYSIFPKQKQTRRYTAKSEKERSEKL